MLDDIREWISDHLIYIIIGAGAFLLLLILIFIVRAVTHSSSSGKKNKTATEASAEAGSDIATVEELTTCSDADVVTLIQSYYQALAAQDVEVIRTLTDELTAEDETAITEAKDIEAYSDIVVYAIPGVSDNTWVVYTTYNCKYINFDTVVPGMSQLYVCTADDGSYYISCGSVEQSVQEYIEAQNASAAVTSLVETTQASYDAALTADTTLAGYLTNKNSSASNALYEADGTELTVAMDCNVRAAADISSDKVGRLTAGQTVVKEGSEAEWIQITYEGQTAYVRWDMFQ